MDSRMQKRKIHVGAEGIDDHCHQGGHGGDNGSKKIYKASRLVRNNVFLKNEFQQVGKGLQRTAITYPIGSKPALNKAQHASFSQHCVGYDQKHHSEGNGDRHEFTCDI